MKLSKLITLAALVAVGPAFAADKHDHAHEHESMHGGLVVEVKDVDLELVAKPDVIMKAEAEVPEKLVMDALIKAVIKVRSHPRH